MDEQKEEKHNRYSKVRYTTNTDKKCPKCGLWSTGSALLCDCGYNFESGTEATPKVQPKRGGCLTAILIVQLIGNPLFGIYYLVAGSSVAQSLPNMPAWYIPLSGIMSIAGFIFAIAIWKWKKWGMYGYATIAGISFFINAIYFNILAAFLGLVGVGILAFLLRQVWSQME